MNILKPKVGWLVVLRFNTSLTAKVISWRLVTHMSTFCHSVEIEYFMHFKITHDSS